VILVAEVDLGRVMVGHAAKRTPNEQWNQIRRQRGCDSVRFTGLPKGDEYVVYDPDRVRSIALHSASPHVYTGTLQRSADGTSGTGRSFTDYPVRIVSINQRPSWSYPVLLGDAHSDELGWAAPRSLRLQ
jgi:hypothetical protein